MRVRKLGAFTHTCVDCNKTGGVQVWQKDAPPFTRYWLKVYPGHFVSTDRGWKCFKRFIHPIRYHLWPAISLDDPGP